MELDYYRLQQQDFSHLRPKRRKLVQVYTSQTYNPWTTIKGKRYRGVLAQAPKLADGYELVDLGYGAQLNFMPPTKTWLLQPIEAAK